MEASATYKLDNGDGDYDKAMETEPQFTAKQLDTSQFNEGVGNTTYIIDNNSSNSIDSVRIGNHSFVPVVDSSLYNISGKFLMDIFLAQNTIKFYLFVQLQEARGNTQSKELLTPAT